MPRRTRRRVWLATRCTILPPRGLLRRAWASHGALQAAGVVVVVERRVRHRRRWSRIVRRQRQRRPVSPAAEQLGCNHLTHRVEPARRRAECRLASRGQQFVGGRAAHHLRGRPIEERFERDHVLLEDPIRVEGPVHAENGGHRQRPGQFLESCRIAEEHGAERCRRLVVVLAGVRTLANRGCEMLSR